MTALSWQTPANTDERTTVALAGPLAAIVSPQPHGKRWGLRVAVDDVEVHRSRHDTVAEAKARAQGIADAERV